MLLRRYHTWLHEGCQRLGSPLREGVEKYRERLEGAMRFVLTPSVTLAAAQIAEKPEALEAARARIMAPWPSTWVDLKNPYEGRGEDTAVFWVADRENEPRAGNVLFLRWDRESNRPDLLPARLDLDRPLHMPQAVLDLAARNGRDFGPWAAQVPKLTHELLAVWALLASHGMTHSVAPDIAPLNRSRARKGLYPLLGYQEIKLTLDAERAVEARTRGYATGEMPLHPVRSHLRLLADSRVVIVRAHWRGNPDVGTRGHGYLIRTTEDLA